VKARRVAAPGATANAVLVADARVGEVATSVYPVPLLDTETPGNTATPPAVGTVVVPMRVEPAGPDPIASETEPVKPLAVSPWASRTTTSTSGVNPIPAVPPVGSTPNDSCVAGPGITVTFAVPATPSLVAVIITGPRERAVTSPFEVTVARLGLPLLQVTLRPFRVAPRESRGTAVSCSVALIGS
jgi:hypothetical protein